MPNADRAFSIRVPENLRHTLEKRLKYRFWDKGRERSNRAAAMADRGPDVALCPLRHNTIGWSGPPHDAIRRYVCLECKSYASEAMIKEMGHDFETAPDYIIHDLMDEVLRVRFEKGNPTHFFMS